MNKSSKNTSYLFFGLLFCLLATISLSLIADDKDKKKKDKKDDGLVGDSKLIFDSGLGKFDWATGKNNYKKSVDTVRRPASKEEEYIATCPSCNKDMPVTIVTSTRSSLDYDFCEHYIGNSPYVFDIWACSSCGYAAFRKAFTPQKNNKDNPLEVKFIAEPLQDEDKAFVKKYLTESMHSEIKQEFGSLLKDVGSKPLKQVIIPTTSKVKNFVAYIDHSNELDDKWKAFFYIRAIYAIRNTISIAPSCTSLNKAFIDISMNVENHLKVPDEDKQQPYVSTYYLKYYINLLDEYKDGSKERLALYLLIAQCFNRQGYYSESLKNINLAKAILAKLKDADDIDKTIKSLSELIEMEKNLSLKAVSYMKEALEQKTDYGNNQNAIVYLIGELSRRCEVYADAYLFLSASKMLFGKETPVYNWVEEHLRRTELKNDDYLLLTPPAYLKQIVLENKKK